MKISSDGRKVQKFRRLTTKIEGLVATTGLSPLIECSLDTGDRGLISAFVKRWHKEMASFHLPVGEVTITLDDVVSGLFSSFALHRRIPQLRHSSCRQSGVDVSGITLSQWR